MSLPRMASFAFVMLVVAAPLAFCIDSDRDGPGSQVAPETQESDEFDGVICELGFQPARLVERVCNTIKRTTCTEDVSNSSRGLLSGCQTLLEEDCRTVTTEVCVMGSDCHDGFRMECNADSKEECINKRCRDPSKRNCERAKRTCDRNRSSTCESVPCVEICREVESTECGPGRGSAVCAARTVEGPEEQPSDTDTEPDSEPVDPCQEEEEILTCSSSLRYDCVLIEEMEASSSEG